MEETAVKKQIEDAKLAFVKSKNQGLGWETDEHAKLGPKIDIYMGSDYFLTYGEIVALAGDWFIKPEGLINAWKTTTDAILGHEGVDNRPYSKAIYSIAWGKMVTIALTNTSHFSPQNIEEWEKFHTQAEVFALKAHSKHGNLSEVAVNELLKKGDLDIRNAFLYNAFADHFLSDSFSAGHIRTPAKVMRENPKKIEVGRKSVILSAELCTAQVIPVPIITLDVINTPFLVYVGILLKKMHDEDGENGLNVQSLNGKKWRAYGDGKLEANENKENYGFVKDIVNRSANSIYYILSNGEKDASVVTDIKNSVPYASSDNSAPMWKVKAAL